MVDVEGEEAGVMDNLHWEGQKHNIVRDNRIIMSTIATKITPKIGRT